MTSTARLRGDEVVEITPAGADGDVIGHRRPTELAEELAVRLGVWLLNPESPSDRADFFPPHR